MTDRHQIAPYPLRMEQELRDRIAREAKANNRSMNAEIVSRLQESLASAPTTLSGAAATAATLAAIQGLSKRIDKILENRAQAMFKDKNP